MSSTKSTAAGRKEAAKAQLALIKLQIDKLVKCVGQPQLNKEDA